MASFRGGGSPPKLVKMMDLATFTVRAVVVDHVLPQEEEEHEDSTPSSLPQHISLGAMLPPIKEEEEEKEEECLPLQQQPIKRLKPMNPRKRSQPQPTKITSQNVDVVLPQEQDSASSTIPQRISSLDAMLLPIKEEEEEKEEEWLTPDGPMNQQRKTRGRPRKIISPTLVDQEQDSASLSLPQLIGFNPMLLPIKKEYKEEERLLPLLQSNTPEPIKLQGKKRGRPRKIISQSLPSSVVQPQDDPNDIANNRKKMNRGLVDLLLPETPKRERSRRGGISITRSRVASASNPSPPSSLSYLGKDFASTTGHSTTTVQSPPSTTSKLEMAGPNS